MGPNDVVFSEYPPPVLVGVGITFMVLPVIVVCLRFFARRFTRVAIGIDDWSIIVALVCAIARKLTLCRADMGSLGTQHGGRHSRGSMCVLSISYRDTAGTRSRTTTDDGTDRE